VAFGVGFKLGTRLGKIPVCPIVLSSVAPGSNVDLTALYASLFKDNSLFTATSQVASASTSTHPFSVTALVAQSFVIRGVGQHLRCIMAMMEGYVFVAAFACGRV